LGEHKVKVFLEDIQEKSAELLKLYEDADGYESEYLSLMLLLSNGQHCGTGFLALGISIDVERDNWQ
jgi:hypothetical protein